MKQKEMKQQIREMSVEALTEEKFALLKEQLGLSMQRATGQLKKNHRMKQIRRNIARIKTLLSEKDRGAGE